MEQNRNTETDSGIYQNIVCDQSGTTTHSRKNWNKDLNVRGKSRRLKKWENILVKMEKDFLNTSKEKY